MLADQLLINGQIHTMDARHPRVAAVAISGDQILAVGDDPDRFHRLLASSATVRDLDGRCVLPGLTDSHIHFSVYALGQRRLNLSGAASLADMLAIVARSVDQTPDDLQPAEGSSPDRVEGWIRGYGWDQECWPRRRFPTAADLDVIVPSRPVALTAKSGHALVANSFALRRAGITPETIDPPGGRIGRHADGQPDGMLYEGSAMSLVTDLIHPPSPQELDIALRAAIHRAWSLGLTSIHDMDGVHAFAAYQRLQARGELGLRVVKYLPVDTLDCALKLGLQTGLGNDWLRVGGIKLFTDGALGPRTAAMLAPYRGEPDNLGILVTGKQTAHMIACKAVEAGLALAVHAIGDRANRLAMDVLGEVSGGGLRHRIEHVQLLHPDDVGRLAAIGVVAAMQPIHATQDFEMANRFWGDRCATAYAWRSLLEAGSALAFGSDAPVEDLSPLLGIHAAVTRRRTDGAPGPDGWWPHQRLTVDEAVRAYTLGAAYAAGLEHQLGSLTPGKLADLVVLDRDIFTCDPMAIAETKAVATMIGGRFVFDELAE